MTEQEFRDQVIELGLTIEVTDGFDYIRETRRIKDYIYHNRRGDTWCTICGKLLTHDSVLPCVLEWQQHTGSIIVDPIRLAALIAKEKQ